MLVRVIAVKILDQSPMLSLLSFAQAKESKGRLKGKRKERFVPTKEKE